MNHSTRRLNRAGLALGAAYLLLVGIASVVAILLPGDGDGLSWVPVVLLSAPWSLVGMVTGVSGAGTGSTALVIAGIAINAVLAYQLGSRLLHRG